MWFTWFAWWLGLDTLIPWRMVFTICHNNNQISDFLYANHFRIHDLVHNFTFPLLFWYFLFLYRKQKFVWNKMNRRHRICNTSSTSTTSTESKFQYQVLLAYPFHLKIQICHSLEFISRGWNLNIIVSLR